MKVCTWTRLILASVTLALSAASPNAAPVSEHGASGPAKDVAASETRDPGSLRRPATDRRGDLIVIDAAERDLLVQSDLPVIWKGSSFFLAVWDGAQQAAATRATVRFEIIAPDFDGNRSLRLFEVREEIVPPREWQGRVLWRSGRKWVVEMDDEEAAHWATQGHPAVLIPREPRGWESRAPTVAYDCSFDPIVGNLVGKTDQTQWLDWIEKLSGVDPVTVAGSEYEIHTRYSSKMFAATPESRAYEFAVQQVESWGYAPGRMEEHSYSVGGGQTWKNLIVTLPGATHPDEIVLLTGHLDSVNLGNISLAPGANDNGTGIGTLFEAARLLRQYRFGRTIKIVWFTGEEDGLLGSEAYVDDHATNDFLGVVNLDMFGWDGDGDRCFEIHVGTLPQSQHVGDCFADSITSYGIPLSRDYLTTGATDRSDHASFWQVNVGAIEIAENYFNDGLSGGCVGNDANPGYHTSNDTIAANMHPPFGFDIARTGLATIAAMALPIEACFSGTPTLQATAGDGSVELQWTPLAGAAHYRVQRATASCEGQWAPIAESSGTSWLDDTADQPVTYFYRVEAVDADGFCISAASNCASATPTVYHASSVSSARNDVCAHGGPGSGDGILDPGESVLLPVTIENDGNAPLSDIRGTLATTTPRVDVIDWSAEWPDLSPGTFGPSVPNHFGLQLASGVSCGSTIDLTLDLEYTEGTNDTGLTLPVGDPFEVILLSEDFSSGIPAGWTVVDGGSGGGTAATWTTSNPGGRSIGSPFDGSFAIADSDEAGSGATQDEELISPSFNASQCSQVVVEFSNQFHWYSSGQAEKADLDVSTDGGSNWSNRLRMDSGDDGYTTPVTKSVDITPDGIGNDVKIRFHYHDASFEWWWAIDNVTVRCARMSCTPCFAVSSPPGEAGTSAPLTVRRDGLDLVFEWGAPQSACDADDYSLYKGDLGSLDVTGYGHSTVLTCGVGSNSFTIPLNDPAIGATDYYLVVADNGIQEGSYGRDSENQERPASASACHAAQNVATCGP